MSATAICIILDDATGIVTDSMMEQCAASAELSNLDVYRLLASRVFSVDYEAVTPAQKHAVKAAVLHLAYSSSLVNLAALADPTNF